MYGAFYRRNLCSPVDEKEMRKAHKRTRAQWNNGEKLLSIHNENWNWSHFSQWIDSEICERTNEVFLDCQNETQSCMPCTHVSRFIWFNVSLFPLLLLHSALVCCWKLLDFETTIHRVLANGSSRGGNGTSNSQNRNDNKRKWNFNFILLFFSLVPFFVSMFRNLFSCNDEHRIDVALSSKTWNFYKARQQQQQLTHRWKAINVNALK